MRWHHKPWAFDAMTSQTMSSLARQLLFTNCIVLTGRFVLFFNLFQVMWENYWNAEYWKCLCTPCTHKIAQCKTSWCMRRQCSTWNFFLTKQSSWVVLHWACISSELHTKKKIRCRNWQRLWAWKRCPVGSIFFCQADFLYYCNHCKQKVKLLSTKAELTYTEQLLGTGSKK